MTITESAAAVIPARRAPRRGAPDLPRTPFLELETSVVAERLRALSDVLPVTAIHYAVRANSHPDVLATVVAAGANFDVASPAEVSACLAAGASPDDLIYGSSVTRRDHLAQAAALGIRVFVVDSVPDVRLVAEAAPGTSVVCRLLSSGGASERPRSRRYGCTVDQATEILRLAADLGLDAAGVSFHVGSRQPDPNAWRAPIAAAATVFEALRAAGMAPWLLGLGGGLPARHDGDVPPLSAYAEVIEDQLRHSFGDHRPRIIVEPGRAVVGDAGAVVSTVVGVVRRDDSRWVHLDAGVGSGREVAIRHVETSADGGATGPCLMTGPAGDDGRYRATPVELPLDLAEGDVVRIVSAGAYTSRYTTAGVNGIEPVPIVVG